MFTKAEIAKLPVEQQEVLAQIELSKIKQRQQLLEQIRGYPPTWRYIFAAILFLGILVCYLFLDLKTHFHLAYALYTLIGLSFVNTVVLMHTTRINQRLDALVKLFEMDHKFQERSDISKDETTG
jgi:hypothetical protein